MTPAFLLRPFARIPVAAPALVLALVLALPAGAVAQSSPAPASTPAPAEESVFLSVVEDVPLMPGLVEDEAGAVVFDAAQGRIAETVAVGASAGSPGRAAVLAFYAETLPALGWRADGEARWAREGEILSLEFEDAPIDVPPGAKAGAKQDGGAKGIAVRFSLSPANPR